MRDSKHILVDNEVDVPAACKATRITGEISKKCHTQDKI